MITRRTFIKLAGLSAIAAYSGAMLSGCGGPSEKKGIFLPSKSVIQGINHTLYTDLFSYDDKGNLTCYTHAVEYPNTNAQGNGFTEQTDYTYDTKGNLTSIVKSQFFTDGRKTVTHEYDVHIKQGKGGLPSAVTLTSTGGALSEQGYTEKFAFTYGKEGAISEVAFEFKSSSLSSEGIYKFDQDGWPTEVSSSLMTKEFRASKDKSGNVTTIVTTAQRSTSSYNKNSGSDSYEYEYDEDGNPIIVSKDGKKVAAIEYTYIEKPSDFAYALGLIAKFTGDISIRKLW